MMAGRTSRRWRKRTSRNRQHGLTACNVLDFKTSERERKHMLEEAPPR
jgi:hypothetical protein